MEPIKVLVAQKKSPSGMIILVPTKDVELSKDLTLKKDVAFYSVTPEIFASMKKPKAVTVSGIFHWGIFIEPVI